ncbi:hypothetical protein BIW11_07519 [Tropilaelaps mercedesae]|uniref:Uncharacterized protein n=1 Tax=Tropilaelaps mercedesae TaxID=418985 RepID=A0A1V9XTL0_9ACAR|nr:hypothetical protein BIW11_07519 [Tropilaelaps mercedesae]
MASRNILFVVLRRYLADQPPKKFKNFAEISQATNQPSQTAPPPRVETKLHKEQQATPQTAPKIAPQHVPKSLEQSSSVAAPEARIKAAGEEYLVPEYFQHNEYSFYDLNNDMLGRRMPQPRAERRE